MGLFAISTSPKTKLTRKVAEFIGRLPYVVSILLIIQILPGGDNSGNHLSY